jgi:hypothetical protein
VTVTWGKGMAIDTLSNTTRFGDVASFTSGLTSAVLAAIVLGSDLITRDEDAAGGGARLGREPQTYMRSAPAAVSGQSRSLRVGPVQSRPAPTVPDQSACSPSPRPMPVVHEVMKTPPE